MYTYTHTLTHYTLVKNYRRFPAVSETTGSSPLTHKESHTLVSPHTHTHTLILGNWGK